MPARGAPAQQCCTLDAPCTERVVRISDRMSDVIVSVEAGSTGARRPNCARCRNHYIREPLKGHKNYCKFKHCKCVKCLLTQERQTVMAKQTAQRRKQQLDEDRIKKGLPLPPSPPPETSQQWSEVITPTPSPPPVSVPTTCKYTLLQLHYIQLCSL